MNSVTLVTVQRPQCMPASHPFSQQGATMLRIAVTTLVVVAAFAAAVSLKFKPSALEPTEPMAQIDDLLLHLHAEPLGVPTEIAPGP